MATWATHPEINLEALSRYMPNVLLWKKDLNSIYIEANKTCAELFGFSKKKEVIGITDAEIPCPISELAETFQQQDKYVIATNKPIKILEIHPCAKNTWKIMLNTKNPFYSEKGDIMGTFAYCLDVTNELGGVATLLSSVSKHSSCQKKFVQNSFILGHDHLEIKLTPRQMECLFYLLRGKTAKDIAAILKISVRTIEQYIDQIKMRFSAKSKAELIQTSLQKGYMNILPKDFI